MPSMFFIISPYVWNNFDKTSTTRIVSQPATKNIISSDFENVDQSHHLQKLLYLSFYRNDGNVVGDKNFLLADLENIGQDHHLHTYHVSAIIQQILTKRSPK